MRIEPLGAKHDRATFSCGEAELDRFLKEIALQGQRKGLAATFVAIETAASTCIVGYYTLSSYLISRRRSNVATLSASARCWT